MSTPNKSLINRLDKAGLDSEGLLVMDGPGLDDCVVGVVERAGWSPVLCYDKAKVVAKIMEADGCECTGEAEEFVEHSCMGSMMGDTTPCFLTPIEDTDHA